MNPPLEEVAYWPGCTVRDILRDVGKAAEDVLRAAGVDYAVVSEGCCGMPLYMAGDGDGARRVMQEAVYELSRFGLVVTSCPSCYRAFKLVAGELGVEAPKALHFSEFAWELLSSGQLKLSRLEGVRATYQDPCELGRTCGVYDEPRRVIEALVGEFREMPLSREEATCCGGGGLMRVAFPIVAVEVAAEKLRSEVLPLGVEAVVTACPFCLLTLSDGCRALGAELRVVTIEELLAEAVAR